MSIWRACCLTSFRSSSPHTYEVPYRIATSPTASAPLQTESHQIYHSLWPLPALSPVPRPDDPASAQAQANNESAYRQLLVHGVLAVLLPTEDLENECLTSLVGQLLSELIIGNLVVGKLSQPWLIWELLIMITRLIRKRNNSGDPDTLGKAEMAQDRNNKDSSADTGWRSWSLQKAFWSFVNWVFLMARIIRLVISIVALSRSLPPRPHPAAIRVADVMNRDIQQKESQSPSHEASISTRRQPAKVPIVEFNAWRCVGDILEIGTRMPWLQGALSMMQWIALQGPGRVAALNGMLDRLMSHSIHILVLDPSHLPPLLRAIRAALFPNNAPGVSSLKAPSSGEQLAALRRRCASALWGLLPRAVGELYYGTNTWAWTGVKANIITNEGHNHATNPMGGIDAGPSHVLLPQEKNCTVQNDTKLSSRPAEHAEEANKLDQISSKHGNEEEERRLSEIETGIVDIFSDAYFNKHLIYAILELVLVRLVPELAEKGVGELWEERLH
ncbi:hypothetical protein NUW58_g2029 [Xylaria curta]|uniref:Uncharacterized protein n=1 Tax=Xylaria curta TaxID=42375 RepID=A0ACC1PIG5_9PEZI|nr:hypothetical protein NUW58_g2029 [Xylaria curta]